ncbi:hypothetical protein HDU93_006613, partial [Gonapodya sp. JEL0774]
MTTLLFVNQNVDCRFREKYHPQESLPYRLTLLSTKHSLLPPFLTSLAEGQFDDASFDDPLPESLAATWPDQGDRQEQRDETLKKLMRKAWESPEGKDDLGRKLFVRMVPGSMSRAKFEEFCKQAEGYESVQLSEPNPRNQMARLGWITFAEGTDLSKALEALNNKTFENHEFKLLIHELQPIRFRSAPPEANRPARLRRDLELIRKLAEALETECKELAAKGGVDEPVEWGVGEKIEERAKEAVALEPEEKGKDMALAL